MSEKDELTLKEALNISVQLCVHLESPTNRDDLIEELFDIAISIQEKYANITRHNPAENALHAKAVNLTEEQQHKHLSQIDELQKELS